MKLRLDRGATTLAAAILLAYASVSDAQDNRTRPPAGASDRAATAAAPATAEAVRDVRLSDLAGMDVRNAKGENLGEVKDLVVDVETGRVAYAVVGIGGFLGIGEKLSAFPMSSFKVATARERTAMRGGTASGDRVLDNDGVKGDRGPVGSDRTPAEARAQGRAGPIDNDGVKGDKGPIGSDRASGTAPSTPVERSAANAVSGRGLGGVHLVLDADPQRLKRAPNFDREQWPDWNDSKYRGEVDRAAGVTSPGRGGKLVRASQLLDADIHDAQKRNVGEVEDLVVDVRTGNVRYAVVDFDQAWTPNDRLVAVPMKALRPAGDKGELVFAGERAQIERAPSFDKGKWPNLNDPRYRGEVDRYVTGWSTAPGARGTATTPGTGMTSAPTDRSRGSTAARSGSTGGGATDTAPAGAGGTAPGTSR